MNPTHSLLAGILLVALSSCATAPRPKTLDETNRVAASGPVEHTRTWAPQAFARAEQLRLAAQQAYDDGDSPEAAALASHALAGYQRAIVQARLAQAEHRIAEAGQRLDALRVERDALHAAQKTAQLQAEQLELRYKVLQNTEPLEPITKADPKREAARRIAARSVLEAAKLLCLAVRIADAKAELASLEERMVSLEAALDRGLSPTPIDDAYRLRSACLRALTEQRTSAQSEAPSRDASDVLLVQLASAFPEATPFRDDRGIVVSLNEPFTKNHELEAGARALLERLADAASANPSFAPLLVLHGKSSSERRGALDRWLGSSERTRGIAVHDAGTRLPASIQPVKGASANSSRLEFVFVPR